MVEHLLVQLRKVASVICRACNVELTQCVMAVATIGEGIFVFSRRRWSCSHNLLVDVRADFFDTQFFFAREELVAVRHVEEEDSEVQVDRGVAPHFEDLAAVAEDDFLEIERDVVRRCAGTNAVTCCQKNTTLYFNSL